MTVSTPSLTVRRTVSAEYLAGIREGREFLKRFPERDNVEDIKRLIHSCTETAREFSPGTVKDSLKGERDFWRNRLKLKMCQRSGRG